MRPSSSASEPSGGLFDEILARGSVREATSDRAWLQAMLDAEAALAQAQESVGLIAAAAAEAITAACRAEHYDVGQLGREATASGNPVVPLVRALASRLPEGIAAEVHLGATSQDILDTAAMLIARHSLTPLLTDLRAAADAAAELAATHRVTPIAGRTLLQHALPTTFGLKAATWVTALDDTIDHLEVIDRGRLAGQLGGAAGTLSSMGPRALDVLAAYCARLDLAEPVLPWHTDRGRIIDLAAALAGAAAAAGKIAGDVVLLAQTEVAEVSERGALERGGSSTLPHKRNPVAAVSAVACARQAPGLCATLLAAAGQHEHERAAGAWHAEWRPLSELLVTSGSAAAWLRDCLDHLEVDPTRMTTNLGMTGGLVMAERVALALAPRLGRLPAHDLVRRASAQAARSGVHLADVLRAAPEVAAHLDGDAVAALVQADGELDGCAALVDRALAAHGTRADGHGGTA